MPFQLGNRSSAVDEECRIEMVILLDELMDRMVDVMPTEDDGDVPMMPDQADSLTIRTPGDDVMYLP